MADETGVVAHRPGALERVQLLEDWADNQRKLADTEARMTAVLDELGLTELATSIHGLAPVGAAAILAETGDRHGRLRTGRNRFGVRDVPYSCTCAPPSPLS